MDKNELALQILLGTIGKGQFGPNMAKEMADAFNTILDTIRPDPENKA